MNKTNYYFDMDGVLANFHEHKNGWKYSGNYNFIRNLKPFINSINLCKTMIKTGENVFISSLCRNEIAKQAKLDWLAEYLPELDASHIIIIIGHGKKNEYMATEDGILIDDKEGNIKAWRKAGMKAVYVETKGYIDLNVIA